MGETVPQVVGPGDGEVVRNPVGGVVTFKTVGSDSDGRLTAFESEIAAGDGPPLHVHANEDEILYVLDGQFRFQLGDTVHEAPPGALMYVPRGVPHCFQNAGDRAGRLLIFFTPAGMEHFFGLTGGDPETFKAAAAQVGMEVVGPPLR